MGLGAHASSNRAEIQGMAGKYNVNTSASGFRVLGQGENVSIDGPIGRKPKESTP